MARSIDGARPLALIALASGLFFCVVVHAQPSHRDPGGTRSRAEYLRAMGRAYLAAGDRGSAAAYFRDAIQASPDDPTAYAALGDIYLERGANRDAIDVLTAGLRRREDSSLLWQSLARALEASGNLDDAARALRTLLLHHPDDVEGRLACAALARRRGAWAEALNSYRAILDIAERTEHVSRETSEDAKRFIAALERLIGSADPVRGAVQCDSQGAVARRPVRRALANCED